MKDTKLRSRRWCFTINNPQETAEALVERLQQGAALRYVIAADEVAPSTGTAHIQGFVEFEHQATMEQCKQRLNDNTAHLEQARGSNLQNRAYCAKGNKFIEWGRVHTREQGSDISAGVVRAIVEGEKHPALLALDYPEWAAYIVNHFNALASIYREVVSGALISERLR